MLEKFRIEVWKDIRGYENLYQVSNFGNVRSLDRSIVRKNGEKLTVHGKVLKPVISKGYCYVRLNNCGVWKDEQVHRLVAEAFISNPNNLPEVNHIDEDKTNNYIDNLEWCSRKYNINYGSRSEKFSKSMKGKLSGEKNPRYGKEGTFKGCKHSYETRQHISDMAKGRIWINNGSVSRRVPKDSLQEFLDIGFVIGRL